MEPKPLPVDLQPVELKTREISENQILADKATGIDNHPRPFTQTPPLVTEAQHQAEMPYSR